MRVFLGNAPWSAEGKYGVRAGSRWPHLEENHHQYLPFPFFLAYAAAVLEERDHEVLLVDGIAERLDDEGFYARLDSFGPDLALLEVSTPSIAKDQEHWRAIRRRSPAELKIALCGLHHPMQDPRWLEGHPEVDFVLIGEYEHTLRDLVQRLADVQQPEDVAGLIYRAGGEVRDTGRRPPIATLDELPWPARHHLPMFDYCDEPGGIPRPSVQLWASRGCPYRCSFCAWPQIMYGGCKYRVRDIVDVIDETEWLVREWGFASVYYDDDTFNLGKQRMLSFCREFSRRQLNVPWAIMARVDQMDREVLEAMAGAGLAGLKYGVESADQQILDHSGKGLDLARVREVVHQTHALGIKTHLTFMLGLPGETLESARRTIDLALELDPESLQFTLATPFPGSALYRELEQTGRLSHTDFSRYDGFHSAVVSTEALSSGELEGLLEEANRRWGQAITRRVRRGEGRQRPSLSRPSRNISLPDEPRVTVIIPNYNGAAVLGDCLQAVMDQQLQPLQIVVVDDASEDHSEDIAEQLPGVEVLRQAENRGFAAAVNAGLGRARSRFVAILNNDTKADSAWLSSSLEALHRHPDVGAVAPKILTFDTPATIYSVGIGVTRSGYTFNIGQGTREQGQYDQERQVLGASGAASVWRREVFEIVGVFDEDLAHYLEDVDFALRAQLEGITCTYEPTAVVRHQGGAAIGGQGAPFQVHQVAQNTLGILLKDMPRQILRRHLARVGGGLLGLVTYHCLIGQGRHSLKGIWDGLHLAGLMVAKRKRVLGHQKVSDQTILELLEQSESYLQEMAALVPLPQRARLRMMGLA